MTVEVPDAALLTPGEVARVFRVSTKTVTRWAEMTGPDGEPLLPSVRTPGGHRRFPREGVVAAVRAGGLAVR